MFVSDQALLRNNEVYLSFLSLIAFVYIFEVMFEESGGVICTVNCHFSTKGICVELVLWFTLVICWFVFINLIIIWCEKQATIYWPSVIFCIYYILVVSSYLSTQ